MKNKLFYECEYCLKKLQTEGAFNKHSCEKMKRHRLCKTKVGLAAFNDYCTWLKLKGKTVTKIETFVDSKFFSSFIDFQKFAAEKGIPNKKMFIEYMSHKGFAPALWRNTMIYNSFIAYFDDEVDVMTKVKISVETLMFLADIFESSPKEAFEQLLPSEISRLIYERRLSPWLILQSEAFKSHLHNKTDAIQHAMIFSVMDEMEWKKKFNKNKDIVDKIKLIVRELEI